MSIPLIQTVALLASAASAALAVAFSAGATEPIRVDFTLAPDRAEASSFETVRLGLSFSSSRGGHSQFTQPRRLAELQGLTGQNLASETGAEARFRLAAEAGRLDCDGVVRRGRGAGECLFTPDEGFAEALSRRGLGRPTAQQQLVLALQGADLQVLDELDRQGYAKPDLDDFVAAAVHGVDLAYLMSMDAAGYRVGRLEKLVAMRVHGVSPDRIRALTAASPSLRGASADQQVSMKIHAVSPEYVREMAELGFTKLTPEQLVQMKIHGVSPDFVREMAKAGYRGLSVAEAVGLRIHGVTPEHARRANAAFGRN
jgi:hypothetical protein